MKSAKYAPTWKKENSLKQKVNHGKLPICIKKYIGEAERKFTKRVYEHIGYARNKVLSKITGYHFNLPGHSVEDMIFTIIEKVTKEKYHISTKIKCPIWWNKCGALVQIIVTLVFTCTVACRPDKCRLVLVLEYVTTLNIDWSTILYPSTLCSMNSILRRSYIFNEESQIDKLYCLIKSFFWFSTFEYNSSFSLKSLIKHDFSWVDFIQNHQIQNTAIGNWKQKHTAHFIFLLLFFRLRFRCL